MPTPDDNTFVDWGTEQLRKSQSEGDYLPSRLAREQAQAGHGGRTAPHGGSTPAGTAEVPGTTIAPAHMLAVRIPPGCKQYVDDIRRLIDAMFYKLSKNVHKGKWAESDTKKAFSELWAEVSELQQALENQNLVEVLLEAADVANFALIVSALAMDGRYAR